MNTTGYTASSGRFCHSAMRLQHPVGDPGDRLLGHLGPVDLRQMGARSPRGSAPSPTASTPSGPPRPARRLRLGTITGSKLPARSRGTSNSTGPISVITVLDRVPLRLLPE